MKKLTTKEMTRIALGAALIAVFSQLAIPVPPVPLTLQVFGVILLSVLLGRREGVLSVLVFIGVGAIGLPVFSNFKGGIGVLVGPTGGYIIGFVALAWLVGYAMQQQRRWLQVVLVYIGVAISYGIGTLQLKVVLDYTWQKAFLVGVYPYIVKDVILTALGVMIALKIQKHLAPILSKQTV